LVKYPYSSKIGKILLFSNIDLNFPSFRRKNIQERASTIKVIDLLNIFNGPFLKDKFGDLDFTSVPMTLVGSLNEN
jgi:hypothetical protein